MDVGKRIGGRFVIEARLGAGGMGVVFRAFDERLGRTVALKVLPADSVGDATARARLLREAHATAVLDHPNILHVYDVGETETGDLYLVLELVRGRTFGEILEEGTTPLAARLRVLEAAARALAYAHSRGFVHRDIKPDNLMVRDDGRVVVLDFGLVKPGGAVWRGDEVGVSAEAVARTLTQVGTLLGTPNFMAPEQVLGETTIDGRTDQFALAVTAYRAVTGRLPWRGTTTFAVCSEIVTSQPDPPSSVGFVDLPPEVDAVILRAMEKDPAARYASMEEFAASLADLADALPTPPGGPTASSSRRERVSPPPARPDPPPTLATPRSPANRRLVAVAAVASAVVLAGGAVLASRVSRPATAPRTSLLAGTTSVLACPLLATSGSDAWVGAAAAAAACSRASLSLGARLDRTLSPAELLELPRHPTSAFPSDPFSAPDARAVSVASARRRGSAWLDGEVSLTPSETRVRLVLRAPDGVERASGQATGADFHDTVAAAVDKLIDAGELPKMGAIDDEMAGWLGTRSAPALAEFQGLLWNIGRGREDRMDASCRALERGPSVFAELTPEAHVECDLDGHGTSGTKVAVDRTTPGSLALTARYHMISGGGDDARALARELEEARSRETSTHGKALLAESESELWQTAGEGERSQKLALLAVQTEPRMEIVWGRLTSVALDDPSTSAVVRGLSAWVPDESSSWRWRAQLEPARDKPAQLAFARRAYALAPTRPVVGLHLGHLLLVTGEREEARAVAAKLSAGLPEQRDAAVALDVEIDASEARFGAALARAMTSLSGRERLGISGADATLVELLLRLAELQHRETAIADDLIARFVLPVSHLDRFGAAPVVALALCLSASPSTGQACVQRVRELSSSAHFVALLPSFPALIAGAERYVRGDRKGAASAWRQLVAERGVLISLLRPMLALAFEAAGDDGLADRVDEGALGEEKVWGGASPASPRAARRALREGDPARARLLARTVVAAWEASDPRVADVDDMKKLLAAR